jgi:hypothetical protein
VWGEFNLVRY